MGPLTSQSSPERAGAAFPFCLWPAERGGARNMSGKLLQQQGCWQIVALSHLVLLRCGSTRAWLGAMLPGIHETHSCKPSVRLLLSGSLIFNRRVRWQIIQCAFELFDSLALYYQLFEWRFIEAMQSENLHLIQPVVQGCLKVCDCKLVRVQLLHICVASEIIDQR